MQEEKDSARATELKIDKITSSPMASWKVSSPRASGKFSPMASGKVADFNTEITAVKDSLIRDLKKKDRYIEVLKAELEKAKNLEVKLAEKQASYVRLKEELSREQSIESEAMELLSEGKKRIYELQEELEKGKMCEKEMHDSFVAQTKQLEKTKVLLEESQSVIKSLQQKLDKCEDSISDQSQASPPKKEVDRLKSELELAEQNLARVENEKCSSPKAQTLEEEVRVLRVDLQAATEAEENNKKAMDDLALALKEVITEANQTKENLGFAKDELGRTKGEVRILQERLMKAQERYREAKKEVDQLKNTSDRLRIEAEESLLSWNGKEAGFVECLKQVEEERNAAKEECEKLLETLNEAENMNQKSKEENQKLRDIMKQAINEANVAKEAATIAKEENSQLKDALSERDEALNFLTLENENLKINEAAALENIAELKRLFSEAKTLSETTKEWEIEQDRDQNNRKQQIEQDQDQNGKQQIDQDQDQNNQQQQIDQDQDQNMKQKPQNSTENKTEQNKDDQKEQPKKPRHQRKASGSFLSLKIPFTESKTKDVEEAPIKQIENGDSDTENTDPLKGSIFDVAGSPKSPVAVPTHNRGKSSSIFLDDEGINNIEDLNDGAAPFDETRKKKALLRRFSDLLTRKSMPRTREQPALE